MATTADFKNGLCIVHNNELWTIVEFLHVKPGKGNTFVRTKLKHIKSGRVQEFRFDAGIKIELARVERRPYQFLYKEDENTYNFMHTETYSLLTGSKSIIILLLFSIRHKLHGPLILPLKMPPILLPLYQKLIQAQLVTHKQKL